ncbi:porin [Microvirgula aerodenitrificans]|uniref:porin n=1 Tax=Microvirgula aerodenitrificans TaxID=57480 RepID=UPI0028E8226C|nr:porin [Microvirgula aerodenitrificans]
MNKKLIAAALAGAFAAPVAMADVTIYGFISAGVEYAQATGGVDKTTGLAVKDSDQYKGRVRIQNENSRIGFKGGEDLGNGLKAVWQVEQAVAVDDSTAGSGAGAWATRNSFVGLQGGFGEVRLGKHDDAYKIIGDSVGLNMMVNTSADNAWGNTTYARGGNRRNNTALYLSPVFSGFQFAASYSADEQRSYVNTNERTNTSVYGGGVKYSANGLAASLGYNHVDDAANLYSPAASGTTSGNKLNAYMANIAYKFGDATLGAGYEYIDYDTYKQDSWTVVGGYQFGAFGLKASYTMLGKAKDMNNKVFSDSDYKANQWLLGATYDLSKRTQVIAYATQIDNKKAAMTNFGSGNALNSSTNTVGTDPQAYGLALKHSF